LYVFFDSATLGSCYGFFFKFQKMPHQRTQSQLFLSALYTIYHTWLVKNNIWEDMDFLT